MSLLLLGALFSLGDKLKSLADWLMGLGAAGVFGISLLDSALVPLPGGPDLAVIALSARNHQWMPVYALAAATGSAIGCMILYLLARRAGVAALRRVTPERRERIENLLGRYDMLAVAVPAILPPPFPFKPFVLCAGVFKLKTTRFAAAILAGRTVRFFVEGWLAVRFGEEAAQLIRRHGIAVVAAVILILLFGLGFRWYRRRLERRSPTVHQSQPPS
jgi:membrane protein YqaA with SNARE-associated domain